MALQPRSSAHVACSSAAAYSSGAGGPNDGARKSYRKLQVVMVGGHYASRPAWRGVMLGRAATVPTHTQSREDAW